MHPYTVEKLANEHWQALVNDAQQRRQAKQARQGASRRRSAARLLHLW